MGGNATSGSGGSGGHALGQAGERLAAAYLQRRGWRVLARNWRFHHKEIDLVTRRGRTVAFVEVKSRGGSSLGHPLEGIGAAKRRDLGVAARGWIARHGRPGDVYRFDAVTLVRDDGVTRLDHFEDAWRL